MEQLAFSLVAFAFSTALSLFAIKPISPIATMKVAAVLVTILGVTSAFAPQSSGRSSTQLQESLADKVRLS